MFFTFAELIDIVIMCAFVGFIFKDLFSKHRYMTADPMEFFKKKSFDMENLKFAIMVTAPAIVLHELGHKFAALYFGMVATFHAAYFWLGLGVLLKMMNFGFIFFVPAYVAWGCVGAQCAVLAANPWIGSVIAFAGPAVNLILWLGTKVLIANNKIPKKYLVAAKLTERINMFLFIFNMLPIPGFDGSHVFSGLFGAFF